MNHAEHISAVVPVLPIARVMALEEHDACRHRAEARHWQFIDSNHRRVAGPANRQLDGKRNVLVTVLNAGRKLPHVAADLANLTERVFVARKFSRIAAGSSAGKATF